MLRVHSWWLILVMAGSLLTAPVFAQDDKKPEEKKTEERKPDDKKADEKKAEEKPAENKPAEGHKTKEVIIHLDNPCGVCVQPNTQHVFVTAVNGIFRYVRGNPHKIFLEIDRGMTPVVDVYGKGPMYNIGPLGCTMWAMIG